MRKVDIHTGGCWEWRAAVDKDGYGTFWLINQTRRAHRISYEGLVGPIPEGLELDHLCRNHGCVNPKHLEAVTTKVNQHRGFGVSGLNARKTHCPRGHALKGSNLKSFDLKKGERSCRTCCNDKKRAARQRMSKRSFSIVSRSASTLSLASVRY